MTTFELGTGVLSWDGGERRTDRYGTIALTPEGSDSLSPGPSPSLVIVPPEALGVYGVLTATVKAIGVSTHIGDLTHGFFPSTPKVGERVNLGEGFLFAIPCRWGKGGVLVGVVPKRQRQTFWLNPESLYRCHEQMVVLTFEEKKRPKVEPWIEPGAAEDGVDFSNATLFVVGGDLQAKP